MIPAGKRREEKEEKVRRFPIILNDFMKIQLNSTKVSIGISMILHKYLPFVSMAETEKLILIFQLRHQVNDYDDERRWYFPP